MSGGICLYKHYLLLQFKRIGKLLPAVLFITCLLTGSIAVISGLLVSADKTDVKQQKVQIGIVGDLTDSFLDVGIYTLKNLDATRFTIDFVEANEEEAVKLLTEGAISAYILIPEGFIASVETGENLPITYVTTNGSDNLGTVLMDELLHVISKILTETQSSITGMQYLFMQAGLEDQRTEALISLNLRYLDFVLSRSQIYELHELGLFNQLSAQGYLFCGILILFLMLWGIGGSSFMIRRDRSMSRVLTARGLSVPRQVICEYIPYLSLMLVSLLCAGFLFQLLAGRLGLTAPELVNRSPGDWLLWIIGLLPAVAMITAMQFVWYETITGVVSSVLLQFIGAITLSYLSGCLYPLSYFPESLQSLARLLPTGAGLIYAGKLLTAQTVWLELILMMVYTVGFLLLAMAVKKHKCMANVN